MRWILVLAIFSLSGCATSAVDFSFVDSQPESYKFAVKAKSFDTKARSIDFLLLHDGDIFDILNTKPTRTMESLGTYELGPGIVRVEVYEGNDLKMEAEFPIHLCDARGGDAILELRPATHYNHGLALEYGCIGAPLLE